MTGCKYRIFDQIVLNVAIRYEEHLQMNIRYVIVRIRNHCINGDAHLHAGAATTITRVLYFTPLTSVPPVEPTVANCPATASPTLTERQGNGYANVGVHCTSHYRLVGVPSTHTNYVVLLRRNRGKASRLSFSLQPHHRHYCHYRPLTLLYPSWDTRPCCCCRFQERICGR